MTPDVVVSINSQSGPTDEYNTQEYYNIFMYIAIILLSLNSTIIVMLINIIIMHTHLFKCLPAVSTSLLLNPANTVSPYKVYKINLS